MKNINTVEMQVRAFYSEIWNKRNIREIPNILEPDFEFRGSTGQTKIGHRGFQEYLDYVHKALINYTCEIDDLVVEENKAFAKMIFSGIHKNNFMGYSATDKIVSWSAAALFIFKNNKVSSLWVLGDIDSLKKQLSKNSSIR